MRPPGTSFIRWFDAHNWPLGQSLGSWQPSHHVFRLDINLSAYEYGPELEEGRKPFLPPEPSAHDRRKIMLMGRKIRTVAERLEFSDILTRVQPRRRRRRSSYPGTFRRCAGRGDQRHRQDSSCSKVASRTFVPTVPKGPSDRGEVREKATPKSKAAAAVACAFRGNCYIRSPVATP